MSPGPARLAAVNVIASSVLALASGVVPRTFGSCAVHPPAKAGLSSPAATATAIAAGTSTSASTAPSPPA